MNQARAYQGETVDQLCHRVVGRTAGVTEAVLRANPGLADLGTKLPEGTLVIIPDLPKTQAKLSTVQLWS